MHKWYTALCSGVPFVHYLDCLLAVDCQSSNIVPAPEEHACYAGVRECIGEDGGVGGGLRPGVRRRGALWIPWIPECIAGITIADLGDEYTFASLG